MCPSHGQRHFIEALGIDWIPEIGIDGHLCRRRRPSTDSRPPSQRHRLGSRGHDLLAIFAELEHPFGTTSLLQEAPAPPRSAPPAFGSASGYETGSCEPGGRDVDQPEQAGSREALGWAMGKSRHHTEPSNTAEWPRPRMHQGDCLRHQLAQNAAVSVVNAMAETPVGAGCAAGSR